MITRQHVASWRKGFGENWAVVLFIHGWLCGLVSITRGNEVWILRPTFHTYQHLLPIFTTSVRYSLIIVIYVRSWSGVTRLQDNNKVYLLLYLVTTVKQGLVLLIY